METPSALLVLCEAKPLVIGGIYSQKANDMEFSFFLLFSCDVTDMICVSNSNAFANKKGVNWHANKRIGGLILTAIMQINDD